jgi:hypothetical protein
MFLLGLPMLVLTLLEHVFVYTIFHCVRYSSVLKLCLVDL